MGIDYSQFPKSFGKLSSHIGLKLLSAIIELLTGNGNLPQTAEESTLGGHVKTIILIFVVKKRKDVIQFWALESIKIELRQEDNDDLWAAEQFKNSI